MKYIILMLCLMYSSLQANVLSPQGDARLAELVIRFYQPDKTETAQIEGMSQAAFAARANRIDQFLTALSGIDREALGTADRIDYDYFQAQLDNGLQAIRDIKIWQKRPADYIPFNSFFAASLDETIPWEDRYGTMIIALTADLDQFKHGKQNLSGPPPLWIERALTLADNTQRYLDTEMLDIIERAPNDTLASQMREAANVYRAALDDYKSFLVDELEPGEISKLAVGKKQYLRLLANHSLHYSPDELVTIGRKLYAETEALMQKTAAEIDPSKTWQQLIEENRMDHVSPWGLYTDLKSEADRARTLVYEELVNVPPDVIEEYRYVKTAHPMTIPRGASGIGPFGFTHGDQYVGYYSLPSIDQYGSWQRKGEFMQDWSRAWYIAQQIPHEVYPGHHFAIFMNGKSQRPARQLAGSAPYTDVSSTMSEGWAVYAEELMYDYGYLNDEPRLYLGHLQHRLWRIARIILDPQFHTGQIDYENMVDFFEGTGTSRGQAHVEATQITNIPAHDVGYYMGVVELKKLIAEYGEIVGEERFNLKDFNTRLLLKGNVPVALIRLEMLEDARLIADRQLTRPLTFTQFADDFFKASFEYSPVSASSAGLHQFDPYIDNLSEKSQLQRIEALETYEQQLAAILQGELKFDDRIDAEALQLHIQYKLHDLSVLQTWRHNPMKYASLPGDAIGGIMNRDYAPAAQRLESMISRMHSIPEIYKSARENLVNPAPVFTHFAIEMSKGMPSFIDESVDLWVAGSGIDDEALLRRYRSAAQAFSDESEQFAVWLETDLLPRSNGDYALGEEKFLQKLYFENMLEIGLEELLAIGEKQLDMDYAEILRTAAEISPDENPRDVIESLAKDYPDPAKLLDAINDSLLASKEFVNQNEIATIPSEVVPIVAETPIYARDGSFASMDTPGAFETVATEAYYYVTPTEEDWSKQHVAEHMSLFNPYTVAMINVHEAFPGHFLQFLYAKDFPTLTRKMVESPMNSEGWAHYTEQMMADQGFNGHDPRYKLSQLTEALIRDVRYVAGVRMHTMGMSIEEAASLFENKSFLSPANAMAEARRGAYDPTYLYYTFGKIEIQKLAADYRRQTGASLKEFHDIFVQQGALPLPLVRRILMQDQD